MKRLSINASPRGATSNSRRILGWINEGIKKANPEQPVLIDLRNNADLALVQFIEADEILIAFPLYADFVPGILKEFIDTLASMPVDHLKGKRCAWIVHSGFPEPAHSEACAQWLKRATSRLGMECGGVIIKGGSESFQMMSDKALRSTINLFEQAGKSLLQTGSFDLQIVAKIAGKSRLSFPVRVVFHLLKPTGLINFYWNDKLKKNNAYKQRFDAPYGEAYRSWLSSM